MLRGPISWSLSHCEIIFVLKKKKKNRISQPFSIFSSYIFFPLLAHHHLESSSSLFKEEHAAPVAGSSVFTCQPLSVILPAPRSNFLMVLTWMQGDEDVAMFGSAWDNSAGSFRSHSTPEGHLWLRQISFPRPVLLLVLLLFYDIIKKNGLCLCCQVTVFLFTIWMAGHCCIYANWVTWCRAENLSLGSGTRRTKEVIKA